MFQKIYLLILIFSIISCGHNVISKHEINDNKTGSIQLSDCRIAEMQKDQLVFNNIKVKSYPKYSANIFSDIVGQSTFIQFDTIRVYLFNKTDTFKNIFISGLVSGQMIYCEIDSTCQPKNTNDWTNERVVSVHGWLGPSIVIDHFELLQHVKSKPTQRRFKFYVHLYKTHVNSIFVFFLELTNDSANSLTPIEKFIDGAKLTFIKKAWIMI